jgi:hypothetical protein
MWCGEANYINFQIEHKILQIDAYILIYTYTHLHIPTPTPTKLLPTTHHTFYISPFYKTIAIPQN